MSEKSRVQGKSNAFNAKTALACYILREDPDSRWTKGEFVALVRSKPTNPVLVELANRRAMFDSLGSFRLPKEYLDWQAKPLMRKPRDISLSVTYGEVLYSLAFAVSPQFVVEAGSGFGISGSYIAAAIAARKSGILLSFEAGDYYKIAHQNIQLYWKNVIVLNENFDLLPQRISSSISIDYAYIDGIHQGEVVYRQLRMLLGFCSPGCVIVVDDAYQYGNGALLPELKNFATDRRVSFAATISKRFFVAVVR